jgi:hypothetical protein
MLIFDLIEKEVILIILDMPIWGHNCETNKQIP